MFCRKCGETIRDDSEFCEHCGFNQYERIETKEKKRKKEISAPINWYSIDYYQRSLLKDEFNHCYPSQAGLEVLIVFLYIFGTITTFIGIGKINEYIYLLIIGIGLIVTGTVLGLVINSTKEKAFVIWLQMEKNIIK